MVRVNLDAWVYKMLHHQASVIQHTGNISCQSLVKPGVNGCIPDRMVNILNQVVPLHLDLITTVACHWNDFASDHNYNLSKLMEELHNCEKNL